MRLRAGPPTPPHDDQKIIEMTSPTMPTTIKITPTVWMLTPETVAVTAHVRIAPAASADAAPRRPEDHREDQTDDPHDQQDHADGLNAHA